MRRILIVFFILFASLNLNAQIAKKDSLSAYESNSDSAQKFHSWGRSSFITGGICTAVGGALMATPFIISHNREPLPSGEMEDMLSPLIFGTGIAFAVVGVATVLIGIPVYATGNAITSSDVFWKDIRYDAPEQRGFGVILDASTCLYWFKISATAGYHFNKRLFLGAGLGGLMDYYSFNNDIVFDLPLFAEFRYSMANRLISPYLGLRAGYDILYNYPYLGADLGLRIRMSSNSPKSLWVSTTSEVSALPPYAGIKMGWSF